MRNENYTQLTVWELYSAEFTTPTQIHKYQFNATAGTTYFIETDVAEYVVDDEYVDTVIVLYDSELNEIAEDDDGGDEYNESYIEFDCSESGTYILYVYEYGNYDEEDGQLGEYDIIVYTELEASQIASIEENETGEELTVTFTVPVYVYSGGSYDPEDPTEWTFFDNSDGGVVIESVTLDESHMTATVVLSGSVGTGDIIEAGDFHNIEQECFNDAFSVGTRDDAAVGSGFWTIGSNF